MKSQNDKKIWINEFEAVLDTALIISQIQVSQIGAGGGGKYSVVSLHWLKETPEKQPDESFEKIYLSTRLFIESLQDD